MADNDNSREDSSLRSVRCAYETRFGSLGEEDQEDMDQLISLSESQIVEAVRLDLEGREPQKAKKLFEWAEKNCTVDDERLLLWSRFGFYTELAIAYLHRGFALLALGDIPAACPLLCQSRRCFIKAKKAGCEVWQHGEYCLSVALTSLCNYLLDPCEENKALAHRQMIEMNEIDSIHRQLFEIYHSYLKKMYPAVYDYTPDIDESRLSEKIRERYSASPALSSDDDYEDGWVSMDHDYNFVVTNRDFWHFCGNIGKYGYFPALAGLIDAYVIDDEYPAESVADECRKLITSASGDQEMLAIAETLLAAASGMCKNNCDIRLYFTLKD